MFHDFIGKVCVELFKYSPVVHTTSYITSNLQTYSQEQQLLSKGQWLLWNTTLWLWEEHCILIERIIFGDTPESSSEWVDSTVSSLWRSTVPVSTSMRPTIHKFFISSIRCSHFDINHLLMYPSELVSTGYCFNFRGVIFLFVAMTSETDTSHYSYFAHMQKLHTVTLCSEKKTGTHLCVGSRDFFFFWACVKTEKETIQPVLV